MNTATKQSERDISLQILNEDPNKYLSGVHSISIGEKLCKVVRDNIKGGIVVFCAKGIESFNWDKQKRMWY